MKRFFLLVIVLILGVNLLTGCGSSDIALGGTAIAGKAFLAESSAPLPDSVYIWSDGSLDTYYFQCYLVNSSNEDIYLANVPLEIVGAGPLNEKSIAGGIDYTTVWVGDQRFGSTNRIADNEQTAIMGGALLPAGNSVTPVWVEVNFLPGFFKSGDGIFVSINGGNIKAWGYNTGSPYTFMGAMSGGVRTFQNFDRSPSITHQQG